MKARAEMNWDSRMSDETRTRNRRDESRIRTAEGRLGLAHLGASGVLIADSESQSHLSPAPQALVRVCVCDNSCDSLQHLLFLTMVCA